MCTYYYCVFKKMLYRFKPPDACYIELLRFRIRPPKNRELPLQLKPTICIAGNKVNLDSRKINMVFHSNLLSDRVESRRVSARICIQEIGSGTLRRCCDTISDSGMLDLYVQSRKAFQIRFGQVCTPKVIFF